MTKTLMLAEGYRVHEKLRLWQPWVLSILLALMPLSFAVDQRAKIVPSVLLFAFGLVLLAGSQRTRHSYRMAWSVVATSLLVLLYSALNILGHHLNWRSLDLSTHILLYVVTAAAFTVPVHMRTVWAGFSLSAILLGMVCVLQHYLLGADRAYGLNGGDWGAIEFAMVLLALALLALVQLLSTRSGRAEKILHAVGMLFGMYGALLTQSRGPLLAFVPVFLALVLMYVRRTGRWRWGLLLVGVAGLGAVVATATLRGEMMGRFAAIRQEITTFDHQREAEGAVRERIEMWRTARLAFVEHPLAGVGIDQFGVYARGEVAAGRSNPVIVKYDHPHNEYLEAAATGGVPGLLVLLLTFAVPLTYFARHMLDADEELAAPATAGVALVSLYVLCALTDNVFYRAMPQSLYFFLVLGLAVLIGRQLQARTVA